MANLGRMAPRDREVVSCRCPGVSIRIGDHAARSAYARGPRGAGLGWGRLVQASPVPADQPVGQEDRFFKRVFQTPFSFPIAPRTRPSTALDACESVFEGG